MVSNNRRRGADCDNDAATRQRLWGDRMWRNRRDWNFDGEYLEVHVIPFELAVSSRTAVGVCSD